MTFTDRLKGVGRWIKEKRNAAIEGLADSKLSYLAKDIGEVRQDIDDLGGINRRVVGHRAHLSTAGLWATAAVVAGLGAYALAPESDVQVVQNGVHTAEVTHETPAPTYTVEAGDNLWNLTRTHMQNYEAADLDTVSGQEIGTRTNQVVDNNSHLAHLEIDNRRVVDGRTEEGPDGIRGDVLYPGDQITMGADRIERHDMSAPAYGVQVQDPGLAGLSGLLAAGAAGLTILGLAGPKGAAPGTNNGGGGNGGGNGRDRELYQGGAQAGNGGGANDQPPQAQGGLELRIVDGPTGGQQASPLDEAVALYASGHGTVDAITNGLGVSSTQLYRAIDDRGHTRRSELRANRINRRASQAQDLYDSGEGMKVTDIAEMLDVSTSTVYRDLKRDVQVADVRAITSAPSLSYRGNEMKTLERAI